MMGPSITSRPLGRFSVSKLWLIATVVATRAA